MQHYENMRRAEEVVYWFGVCEMADAVWLCGTEAHVC